MRCSAPVLNSRAKSAVRAFSRVSLLRIMKHPFSGYTAIMHLLPIRPDDVASFASGNFYELEKSCGRAPSNLAALSPLITEIADAYDALYARTGAADPWIGYLAASSDADLIIGSCGFKANLQDACVEIGYFTFPDHEGRGWGRAMASALADRALSREEIRTVRARSLGQPRQASSTALGSHYRAPWLTRAMAPSGAGI